MVTRYKKFYRCNQYIVYNFVVIIICKEVDVGHEGKCCSGGSQPGMTSDLPVYI